MTVGDLIDLLSACDRGAPVRLAMNPFFPMAHRLTQVVQADDGRGQPVVYLAEGGTRTVSSGLCRPRSPLPSPGRAPSRHRRDALAAPRAVPMGSRGRPMSWRCC